MKCEAPISVGEMLVGCRQCPPCRFNIRREWATRIMLEAGEHEKKTFVTLTYDDENNSGELHKSDVRDFLKRLRAHLAPQRIRYVAVGEYGDKTDRPHYHLALFGYPNCERGRTRNDLWKEYGVCCDVCSLIREKWRVGGIMLGELNEHSAQYIVGYVLKKMTHRHHPNLRGREPEFKMQSTKPGIGYDAVADIADAFLNFNLDCTEGDVPSSLREGSIIRPIGRYLKNALRKQTGMDNEKVKAFGIEQSLKEVRELRKSKGDNESLMDAYKKKHGQKIKSFNARQSIFRKDGEM